MQKATVNLLPRLSHRLLPARPPLPVSIPTKTSTKSSHAAAYKPHTPTPSYYGGASWMEPFNPVYVQPSIYGTDNTCQLNALESKLEYKGADNARAVVAFDPLDTDRETLDEWHELGVRGVRINLKSGGARPSPAELKSLLGWYAEVIRPQETWALNLHVELDMAAQLEVLVPKLGVKVVLDHFGGWGLLRLMQNEDVYVKISAPYRITSNWEELEPFFRDLANVRQGRGIVFASDWPHTRFEDVDAERWIKMCLDWCGEDKKLKQNLFRYNAERLWDVEPGES
ncbi:hypothetical protein H2199_000069 [Coniosporium tulheliwenetii]|uniref:Uncharacterized protein n=1 Tax=Coniosporium tulheliwenetii TaxID=3383036 RepID=A0ACC2ZPB6_9PEZI|nr:hypothetical protein H2199_000069 [Cladosporium sp. JES 115]